VVSEDAWTRNGWSRPLACIEGVAPGFETCSGPLHIHTRTRELRCAYHCEGPCETTHKPSVRRWELRTWQLEGLFVVGWLIGALVASGKAGDWREWVAALGVQLGFHHASVADRLREAEEAQWVPTAHGDLRLMDLLHNYQPHRVECVAWLQRYWVGKELAWVVFFLAHGLVSPLVGCAVFLLHPFWRRWYRARFPSKGHTDP
jgi:hypothetical protein